MMAIVDFKKKYGRSAPAFEEAIDLLHKAENPVEKILQTSAYWIPMQFVYVQMVKNKDLSRVSELPKEKRVRLWEYVKNKPWPQWKKITVLQSLYVWENIRQ